MDLNFTESAKDLYDQVEFKTDSIYNWPPPDPFITFSIGGAFSLLAFVLWVRRVRVLYQNLKVKDYSKGTIRLRCWLTAYIENDCALFTCVRMAAQSFLFLAGIQLNYTGAFFGILGVFTVESFCDPLRVLLCFREAVFIDDLVVTSKFLRADLRKHPLTTTLQPHNVYEDLTRDSFIVGMVFATQVLLIGFVLIDLFSTHTHYCLDGSSGCPVGGTLGSWAFYVLGIFQACVFLLGPKSNFGQSEQNAAYWIQLLLTTKQSPTYTWYDTIDAETKFLKVKSSEWKHWIRFYMSFLINGVGFHILVHALPIQIASQSSLVGVVFRAVGMIYLVNLDDSKGYVMAIVPDDDDLQSATLQDEVTDDLDDASVGSVGSVASFYRFFSGNHNGDNDVSVPVQAQKIIAKAQAKLDALQSKARPRRRRRRQHSNKSKSSASSRGQV
ncbi:expressed unknown protein [Seminavis robusta]|uniref:Uncharacterized protein n=1 Tax=Seminavis robusta TaxID=568900 RepID=A0A9N8DEP7_9STRA|nr:expressed unknown protein [Seminavis robusta]|eukprot:Sro108_g054120.1 n/a (441) ;mRNA; r:35297-36708